MARTITDEEIKLSIIINGNPAQKQLLDLEKATRKLNEEKKQLQIELRRVGIELGKDSDKYKELSAQLKITNTEIDNNKAKMKFLQNQIGLTSLTMHQLREKAHLLKMTLQNLVPGTEDFIKYENELKKVNARLGELNGKAQQSKFSIGSLADGFNRYAALGASVVATLTGVVFSIQKMIDINAKLSDAQADVMKTTGMTKKEVDDLGKSFGLLETRTSRIDLYKIAEQGGRLGIPKAEIQDFVKSMNMAAVSLGDSFTGGVDQVAESLGKIKFLFKETKDMNVEQAYQSIGSAINDLGANGTANEANIAEFTKRIGSLTDVLKPTVQETLALGTAFEESGIEAEQSSRAYNIFMKSASTDAAKFAKVMNMSQKAVEDMINTNPLNFMLEFSKGMRGMDATQVAKTLDYLGVNADGANKVIGAMGNNFERFHELIDLSNKSFSDGTSMINEYNVKNENLAATLEKISKKVSGWFSSESFINWLGGAVNWFAKFIGAAKDADGSVSKWRNTLLFLVKAIIVLSSAMASNAIVTRFVALTTTEAWEATKLYTLWVKAKTVAENISIIGTQALAIAQMLLTGNVKGAAQAFRVLTATMNTTPWGFIISAIVAIGAAYVVFSEKAKQAATAQSLLNEHTKEANDLVQKETQTLYTLLAIAKDETASKEARLAAIKKINEISPEYLGNLTLENIKTAEGKKLLDAYVESLQKKAMMEVLSARQKALLNDIQERKNKSLEEEVDLMDKLWAQIKVGASGVSSKQFLDEKAVEVKTKALLELQNQLNLTNEEMKKFLEKNPELIGGSGNGPKEGDTKIENGVTFEFKGGKWIRVKSDYTIPGDDEKGKKGKTFKSEEEMARQRLEFEAKTDQELLKLQRQLEDDKLAIKQDGYEKDVELENQRYQREIDDLEKQKVHAEEMAKLDVELAKAKKDKDVKYYDFLIGLKTDWQKKNDKIDDAINNLEIAKMSVHQLKLAEIEEKAAKNNIQKAKEKFDREKVLRDTQFQMQLAALGNNEAAKAKLKKEHEEKELAEQEKFLKELLDKFNTIIGKGKLENIDLSLLTPEQVDEFEKEAQKIGLTLAELLNKRNELIGGQKTNVSLLGVSNDSVDILGFTKDNWNQFFDNLKEGKFGIDEIVFAVSALNNMYAKYAQFVTANENAQLKKYETNAEKKKKKLKNQLDQGIISQDQYTKQVDKIDGEIDKKKAEFSLKQAKREKFLNITSAISGTASAVIGALGQKPWTPANFAFAGIVGAMGALQLATILKTPLPSKGFEDGLYPDYVKRQQDGKIFRSTGTSPMKSGLFSKPRILVGEGPGDMPEMVIDKRAYSQISPETKNALIRELQGIKGFEGGYYNRDKMRIEVPASNTTASQTNSSDELLKLNLTVMSETLVVLKDLRDNGVIVDNRNLRSMKNLQEGIDNFNSLRNKAKKG